MLRKYISIAFFIIVISLYSSVQVSSAASASFKVKGDLEKAEIGQEVEITITGYDVVDLYGYELELEFDPNVLQYKSVKSGISNMVYPIDMVDNRPFLLVSTKIGNVPGANGEVLLATITFKVIGESKEANVKLKSAKLAASDATSMKHEVNEGVQVELVTPEPDAEPTFTDIAGHWAEANIKRAIKLGFIKGYGDDTFRPDREVSRAEFAVMIYDAFGYQENSNEPLPFSDHAQFAPWSGTAISALAAEGIISGYDDGTFRPNRSIRRSELAVMMSSILKLDMIPTDRSTFSDANDMADWSEPSIAAVTKTGLLKGRGNNRFKPNESTTRAEAVQVIISMLDYMQPANSQGSGEGAKAE